MHDALAFCLSAVQPHTNNAVIGHAHTTPAQQTQVKRKGKWENASKLMFVIDLWIFGIDLGVACRMLTAAAPAPPHPTMLHPLI
jgi:hypothetical protein